ncbi:MAG: helix-turn-helix domain-containing protein [Betaproteobacteria bacterium]|nr:helix-turn-helix domain-containing protein [Betaproteobacteria bacterium]
MSSNRGPRPDPAAAKAVANTALDTPDSTEAKNPFLVALGTRVKALRSRRGMTRRATAHSAGVSERHLANLEYGIGNASILVLQQIADALHCPIAELIGDETTSSPEWLLLRSLLEGRDDTTVREVRLAAARLLGDPSADAPGHRRIALIGLRGAGKTTLGQALAQSLGFPFIELSREIERLAGCVTGEIQALYGQNAYRRYERRALEETLAAHEQSVIATPGGLVTDAGSFNLLLGRCTTVWLKADPEDHMRRVVAQGDMRPMAASREAMQDLKNILDGRSAFYSKATVHFDTSGRTLEEAQQTLLRTLCESLEIPIPASGSASGSTRRRPPNMH